jgi:hypothetical protein
MTLGGTASLFFDAAALDPTPVTVETEQRIVAALEDVRQAIADHPELATPEATEELAGIAQKLAAHDMTQAGAEQALEHLHELFPGIFSANGATVETSGGAYLSGWVSDPAPNPVPYPYLYSVSGPCPS